MTIDSRLHREVEDHPYPLLFATISGAHLYGFPSADSDYDLRGVHLLPLEELVGLDSGHETIERSGIHDGLEIDLVTHDAKKFFELMHYAISDLSDLMAVEKGGMFPCPE